MSQDDPRPAVVLREVVPTTKHAQALVDLVVGRLGDRAVVHTSNEGKNRVVFLRAGGEGTLVLPWPLLSFAVTDPPPDGEVPDEDVVIQLPEAAPGEPIEIPMVFHAVPAALTIHDGSLHLGVEYRWNGRWKCSSEAAELEAFAELLPVLARSTDNRLELLAEYVASLDLGRHGPARVLLPRQTPGGASGTWAVGRVALRQAMAERRAPPGSFWAVADGYVGSAIAFGATRDEALGAWRKEVERVRPKPPPPVDPTTLLPPDYLSRSPDEWSPDDPPESEAMMTFLVRGWDAPPFDPSPATVPAAIVRVAALPTSKPSKGVWTRWIGEWGSTHAAVRVPMRDGYALVGETLLPRVDLATLEDELDALDAAKPEISSPSGMSHALGLPPPTHITVRYRCTDLRTGLAIDPVVEQSHAGAGFDARGFDGSALRSYLVRVRELG